MKQFLLALMITGMLPAFDAAEIKMTKIFSDNMVLQRDMPVPVWGWSAPGESVSVKFMEQEKSAVADVNGKWMVRLDPLSASCNPEILTVTGKSGKIELKNIVVGEVWLCSGQSNMASSFSYLKIADEIKDIEYPMIRLGGFGGKINPVPTELIFPVYGWSVCNSKNLQNYPAVPYYFAFHLWNELRVPVGVINASAGSSSIESWMSPESFANNKELEKSFPEIEKVQRQYKDYNNYSIEEKEKIALEISNDKYGCILKGRLKGEKLSNEESEYFFRFSLLLRPACLYNYEIRPLIPFAIRGAIWYQGETDAWRKENIPDYALKQKALVDGWRQLWGQGDFPFYFAMLAPYKGYPALPAFWLEQYKAANEVKNSAMISTVDISDASDVHPKNKRDVGKRFALLALKNIYGKKDIVASGPVFKSMETVNEKMIISFENIGDGLVTKDGKNPDSFELAGTDGKFHSASAVIKEDKVEVYSPEVKIPVYVRYAWSHVANPNLLNKNGLPVFPFNTTK